MTGAELRLLANHMGHSVNIHADHYALQSNLLERTKVARVLAALENGNLHKMKERTDIEEVHVQDSDVLEAEGNIQNLKCAHAYFIRRFKQTNMLTDIAKFILHKGKMNSAS